MPLVLLIRLAKSLLALGYLPAAPLFWVSLAFIHASFIGIAPLALWPLLQRPFCIGGNLLAHWSHLPFRYSIHLKSSFLFLCHQPTLRLGNFSFAARVPPYVSITLVVSTHLAESLLALGYLPAALPFQARVCPGTMVASTCIFHRHHSFFSLVATATAAFLYVRQFTCPLVSTLSYILSYIAFKSSPVFWLLGPPPPRCFAPYRPLSRPVWGCSLPCTGPPALAARPH